MTASHTIVFVIGMLSGMVLMCALIWSIFFPTKRLWPPRNFKSKIPTVAWGLTLSVYAAAISLGLWVWKEGAVPSSFLWVSGSALILVGNLVAWRGAFAIGLKTTSGGKGELVTTGLYRYSRNPQYLADIAIFLGIGLLFSSIWVWPVVVIGIIALVLAPYAEEPWLREHHGQKYVDYCATTGRFF